MTSKLEKQFFDTFEIEPKSYLVCTSCWDYIDAQPCEQCYLSRPIEGEYPKITDHILLKLIFLQPLSIEFKYPRNIEELRNILIRYYIKELSLFAEPSEAEIFKQQVQAIFEEDANDR